MRVPQYHLVEVVERVMAILGPEFELRGEERVLATIEERVRQMLEELKQGGPGQSENPA